LLESWRRSRGAVSSGWAHDQRDRGREALPLRALFVHGLPAGAGERIELRAPVVLAVAPLGLDPPLLLELVERGIERALADGEEVVGHLPNPLRDRPAVHRLGGHDFQDQQVERALYEVGRFAHGLSPWLPTGSIRRLLSVIKGRAQLPTSNSQLPSVRLEV